jgi:hypothetical protein
MNLCIMSLFARKYLEMHHISSQTKIQYSSQEYNFFLSVIAKGRKRATTHLQQERTKIMSSALLEQQKTNMTGGNPLQSDLALLSLLEKLEHIESYSQFVEWKGDFLDRFEFFLAEEGSAAAEEAYQKFRQQHMEKVVKKTRNLAGFVEEGSVSAERVSVKGRNAMNELSVILLDTATRVRELAPPTIADEERHGFSKYHLGSVLVRDGFQEYERLNLCKDILTQMKETCLNAIDDDKMLAAIKKYDDELNRFVALMQDIGLYRIMIKNREFEFEKKETEKKGAAEEESPPNDTTETDEAETYESDTEPKPVPKADDKQEESPPKTPSKESPPKTHSKRKSKKYSATGKWNSFPEAASPSARKSKISQDLASPAFKGSKMLGKAKERAPEEVFVTPARKSKKLPGLPFDGDDSSIFPSILNLQDDYTTAPSTIGSPTKTGRPPKPSKPSGDKESARMSETSCSLAATGDASNEDMGTGFDESTMNVTEATEGGLNPADREHSSQSELNDTANSAIHTASSVVKEVGNSQTDVTTTATTTATTTVINTTEVLNSVERETRTDIMTASFTSLNENGTVLWSNKDQDADYVETEFGQSGAHWLDSMTPRVKEKPGDDGQKTKWGPGVVRRMTSFRFLTFCGVDDSIDPKLLGIISKCYPLVEFAVMLRPDMSGQPRYASLEWLQELVAVQKRSDGEMRLAAHLCGSLVNEILKGDDTMLLRLAEMQFQRVQINATAINGVNTHQHGKYAESFLEVVTKHPTLEITLQKNKETKPLWEGIQKRGNIPSNFSMLFDESKGKGVIAKSLQSAPTEVKVGYAGGVGIGGRYMIKKIMKDIIKAGNGQQVWMSMETGVRATRNGKDVFDIDACYQVIDVASEMDIQSHPNFVA